MNNVTSIPFDTGFGGGKLIMVTDKSKAAAEEKIALIQKRAAELDNTAADQDPAAGIVDAWLPTKEAPQERVVVKTDGPTQTFAQTVTTSHRRWFRTTTVSHTEQFEVTGKNVKVSVTDDTKRVFSLLGGLIRKSDADSLTMSFDYDRQ